MRDQQRYGSLVCHRCGEASLRLAPAQKYCRQCVRVDADYNRRATSIQVQVTRALGRRIPRAAWLRICEHVLDAQTKHNAGLAERLIEAVQAHFEVVDQQR